MGERGTIADYDWPDFFPEKVRVMISDFWANCFGRTMRDWESYVEKSAPGGLKAVGAKRQIMGWKGARPVGRFIPLWNNMCYVLDDDGELRHGSYEQSNGGPCMTKKEWLDRAKELFGDVPGGWKFKCPICGSIQSIDIVHEADPSLSKADIQGWIYYNCKGRYLDTKRWGGCNYTLGGFIRAHKLEVLNDDGSVTPVFEFGATP